ncbi:MAG: MFS transporter [Chloroflexi bacterium]|nr:MFS transporter [Chloroflexota bacterium]
MMRDTAPIGQAGRWQGEGREGRPPTRRWYDDLALNAYFFGLSFMWNALHPILLPLVLLAFGEETKNTLYGLLTFAGLIVALITQPLSGALSDYTRSRLGRRRPWILLGTLLDALWLVLIALGQRWWLVAIAYLLLQFTSNVAHGPAQGLIPDLVPPGRRGIAAGVKNLLEMFAIVASALAMGRLSHKPLTAVMVTLAILWGMMAITCGLSRESSTAEGERLGLQALRQRARQVFRVDFRLYPSYGRLLLVRFFILLGSYSVQSFALYYLRDVLELPAPARAMSDMMTVVGLSVIAVVYPAGVLSERWGRKALSAVACALSALGLTFLVLNRDPRLLPALAGCIGVGIGIFSCVNWAWATDLVPAAEAGKYLGLSNLATAGSAAVARLLGPAIDSVNHFFPKAGYSLVFLLAAASAFVGLILILRMPEGKANTQAQTP